MSSFIYNVFALCEKSVGEVLTNGSSELSPAQFKQRAEESLAILNEKLQLIPGIERVDFSKRGIVTIHAKFDVGEHLRRHGLRIVDYGQLRQFPVGALHLFYIRATLTISPENPRDIPHILASSQKRIEEIVLKEFGGVIGPDPYTFLVPGDPDARWLPSPSDRNHASLAQFSKVEVAILRNGIHAEFGIRTVRLPVKLSPR